jgi:hypothetical protein
MSHGQLFVRALDSFLHRKRSEGITAKLSEIYADPSSGCDPVGGRAMTRLQARQGVEDLRLRILPYLSELAYRLFSLPLHHRDPFGRALIAQALTEDIPIVTPDEHFLAYKA